MNDSISVLHVDDDPSITDLTGTFLERENDRFTVETAVSADEGLDTIRDRPPDCIVSDYNMPGTDGIEFLQAVREDHPDIPFILFTGKGSEAVASDAIAADVTDYLQKRSGSEQYELLANRIQNAVHAQRETQRADRQEELMRLTEFAGDTGGFELDTETGEILMTDGARRINDIPNQANLSLDEAIGLYHPEDREDIRQTIDRARQTGEQTHGTWRTRPEDDDERLLDVTFTPSNTDGDTEILHGSIHDITDQHERQQELEEYETVIESLTDAVYVLDEEGRFTYINDEFVDLVGYDRERILGSKPSLIKNEGAVERAEHQLGRLLSSDGPGAVTFEVTVHPREGEPTVCEDHMGVLPYDGEEFNGSVGTLRDVTEQQEREAELRETTNQLQDVMDTVESAMWIRNADNEYVYMNQAHRDLFDIADDTDIAGKQFSDVLPAEIAEQFRHNDQRVYETNEPVEIEETVETDDGSRDFLTRIVPLFDNGSVYAVCGIATDVTEQKTREQRLEEFASIVSHDLRSPLVVAEGQLELAEGTSESEHLTKARDAIERSQALIDDLLTLAREGDKVDEIEPVGLVRVAESSWQTVETTQATLDAGEPEVIEADRSRLQQLFENLYRNAVEHGGEDVTVSVGEMSNGFYVADTGPGVPETERANVFGAGYSTNEEGTGFGLRIVEQIAEAHGWGVTVTESEQGGARFEFTGVERVD